MSNKLIRASQHSFAAGVLAGLVCAGAAPALAQGGLPNFSGSNVGWVSVGGEWIPLPGSPPPVTQDPAHRYTPNNVGGQPTFRIADISNPNLTQFAKDSLKKTNEAVLAGKPMLVALGALLGDRRAGLAFDPRAADVLCPDAPAGQNARAAR